nr:hypothetical protein [Pontibacter diazotrophicus]
MKQSVAATTKAQAVCPEGNDGLPAEANCSTDATAVYGLGRLIEYFTTPTSKAFNARARIT